MLMITVIANMLMAFIGIIMVLAFIEFTYVAYILWKGREKDHEQKHDNM
jgi:hypothetical protein